MVTTSGQQSVKPDLDSAESIQQMVRAFYQLLLNDPQLAPFFVGVDLPKHLPRICQYWEKLLLKQAGYKGHTINVHRALKRRRNLSSADYARWLVVFKGVLEDGFHGVNTDRAVVIASKIAANMERALGISSQP
ncbi:MAG: hemoglobin [Paraglaciecola psychrophila]